jgi:hypothetical protein
MKSADKPVKPARKRPGDPLVFDYRSLPYGRFALIQIFSFSAVAVGVFIYFQSYSKWRGGFIHHPEAWGPVVTFLVLFLLLTMYAPVRDLLTVRNERIEVHGPRLLFFNMWNRKKFDAKLSDIELLKAGIPVTSRVKRYVFKSGKQSFFFSADIGDVKRLLRLLNTPE